MKRRKRQNPQDTYHAAILKCKERIAEIEKTPYYDYYPAIKAKRIQECQEKIKYFERKLKSLRRDPLSSAVGCQMGKNAIYIHTNVSHPYQGGRCSPR